MSEKHVNKYTVKTLDTEGNFFHTSYTLISLWDVKLLTGKRRLELLKQRVIMLAIPAQPA